MLATLLAFGIDPKRSVVFYQEDVSIRLLTVLLPLTVPFKNQCHTDLSWILSCITPIGQLRRMTTWKVCVLFVAAINFC